MKTNISSKVEGTIKEFQGSTLVLSDVIISYNTGRNRYLSIMEIEKEEISDLSILPSLSPPSNSSLPFNPNPKVVEDPKPVHKDEGIALNSRICSGSEETETPLVEIVYTSKKQQSNVLTKNTAMKPLQNSILGLETKASQVKHKEFDFQTNLMRFDKNKEFEGLKVNEDFNSKTKEEASVGRRSPLKNAVSENENPEKNLSSCYDPSSLVRDSCIRHNIPLSMIFELGGKELANLIFHYLDSSLSKKIFFILGSTFYSEFALSSLKHLSNRNYRIYSFIPKSTKDDTDFSARAFEMFKKLDVVCNQDASSSFKDYDLIIECSNRDRGARTLFNNSLQILNSTRNNMKLILLGSDSSLPFISISEVLFFGLVEDTTSLSSKNAGRLIDIGLPKDVYLELGINYPFGDSFSIPISL